MADKKVLISLKNIKKHFPLKRSFDFFCGRKQVKAVDGVTLDIYENETLGLVGESGCGKSTLGRVILNLYKQTSGYVLYDDKNLSELPKEEMRRLRRELQIVFQDPYSSLNPRLTVWQLMSEPLIAHGIYKKNDIRLEEYVLSVMEGCGLQRHMLHRYPHQFSGGQRQRLVIARALTLTPRFVVCDESVSTLDVSIQSQILNLLLDLKEKNKLTYLFISHDLAVVRFIADRIAVMYLGNIVELCDAERLFENPLHPYTKALLAAIPGIDDVRLQDAELLQGDVPSPIDPPQGCKFHPRCTFASDRCSIDIPLLSEMQRGHFVACHKPLVSKEE